MEQSLLAAFAAIFVTSVNGLAHPLAEPTAAALNEAGLLNGRSPAPTPAPKIPKALLARQGDVNIMSTCGFVNGSSEEALTCANGYGCAYWTTASPDYFGCCPVVGGVIDYSNTDCENHPTSCIGYDYHTYTVLDPFISNQIEYCGYGGSSRYCGQTILSSDGTLFTQVGCNTYSNVVQYAYATYAGEPPIVQTTPITTPIPIPIATSTSTSPIPTTTTITPTPIPPTPKPNNTGAIAGGAVGGVFVLAAIAGGIFFLIRRKRKQRDEATLPEISQYNVSAGGKY